jgi:hypothetical protein
MHPLSGTDIVTVIGCDSQFPNSQLLLLTTAGGLLVTGGLILVEGTLEGMAFVTYLPRVTEGFDGIVFWEGGRYFSGTLDGLGGFGTIGSGVRGVCEGITGLGDRVVAGVGADEGADVARDAGRVGRVLGTEG